MNSPLLIPEPRTITGFTPSGPLHLGALLAVIEPFKVSACRQDALVFISDLHALTLHHDPKALSDRRREFAMLLMACGLDDSAIFMQSDVPEVGTLHYLLESTATYGEVARMVQFKEKSTQQGDRGVRLSLLSYPVLMAADILAYGITQVPVGEDQLQHLEITRLLARRFNAAYGDTFVVPEPIVDESVARIMDLSAPTSKMSKSNPQQRGVLQLLDRPEVIFRKVSRAVTDTETEVRYDVAAKPGVSNLLVLLAKLTATTPERAAQKVNGYGDLKRQVADAVIERLAPIQATFTTLAADLTEVDRTLARGAERARELARRRVGDAQRAMGLRPPLVS